MLGAVKSVDVASDICVAVGPDRVTISGPRVIIDARREFPDWQVREFARIPVLLQGRTFFLSCKLDSVAPWKRRYVLDPWPENLGGGNGTFLAYDEAAVAERDAVARGRQVNSVVHQLLLPITPLLGLLWSETKQRLAHFGFVPRRVTALSIYLVSGVVILEGAFSTVFLFGAPMAGRFFSGGLLRAFAGDDWARFDLAVLALGGLDSVIRYDHYLRGTDSPWGFLEWLKCLLPRRR